MSDILHKIWYNWKENKDICENCPNNDNNNYWHPLFFGNPDANVMIIAETPAYNIEGYQFRKTKNYYKFNEIKLDVDEMLQKIQKDRFNSSKNWLSYIMKIMLHRSMFTQNDVYFTNVKKCGDIKNKSADNRAYEICKSYLENEIKYVNPKIIIVLGKKAWVYVNLLFDINCYNQSILKEHKNFYLTNNTYFLIFAHWGYFRKQGKINQYKIDINRGFNYVGKNI